MGFGFDFPGEVMAGMLVTLGATAMGIAAEAADGHEAGGQDRALGLELFLAGLEEPADQGGVLGYFHFHTLRRLDGQPLQYGKCKGLSVTSLKSVSATTFFRKEAYSSAKSGYVTGLPMKANQG